jgi:hypothetical protein
MLLAICRPVRRSGGNANASFARSRIGELRVCAHKNEGSFGAWSRSESYGFPLGVELSQRIVDALQPGRQQHDLLLSVGFTREPIEGFRDAFKFSGKCLFGASARPR